MLLPHPQLLYTETVVIAERCNLETQYSAAFKEKKKRKQKGRKLLEIPRSSLTRLAETREKKGGNIQTRRRKHQGKERDQKQPGENISAVGDARNSRAKVEIEVQLRFQRRRYADRWIYFQAIRPII